MHPSVARHRDPPDLQRNGVQPNTRRDPSGGSRPDEVRAKTNVDWAAVVWARDAGRRVVERVIRGRQLRCVVTHQIRYDRANPVLLVVEHDRFTACRAGAELEWPIRILSVERLSLESGHVVDGEVA